MTMVGTSTNHVRKANAVAARTLELNLLGVPLRKSVSTVAAAQAAPKRRKAKICTNDQYILLMVSAKQC